MDDENQTAASPAQRNIAFDMKHHSCPVLIKYPNFTIEFQLNIFHKLLSLSISVLIRSGVIC